MENERKRRKRKIRIRNDLQISLNWIPLSSFIFHTLYIYYYIHIYVYQNFADVIALNGRHILRRWCLGWITVQPNGYPMCRVLLLQPIMKSINCSCPSPAEWRWQGRQTDAWMAWIAFCPPTPTLKNQQDKAKIKTTTYIIFWNRETLAV